MFDRNIEARVEKGAKLLEARFGPLWYESVDTDRLNIADDYDCVLGQLYELTPCQQHSSDECDCSDYGKGSYDLMLFTECGTYISASYGFSTRYRWNSSWKLTLAWLRLIHSRYEERNDALLQASLNARVN